MQQEQIDLDQSTTSSVSHLQVFSWFFGVSYAFLFACGLGHQCVLNFKNKSTKGYSTDYCIISLVGFSFLLMNQTVGFLNPASDAGRVGFWDMAFAVSSFTFGLTCLCQTMIYPSDTSMAMTKLVADMIRYGHFKKCADLFNRACISHSTLYLEINSSS